MSEQEALTNLFRKLIDPIIQDAVKKALPEKEKNGLEFRFVPVQKIFTGENKLCSKSTFYAHVRSGDFTVYKSGNLTFVDKEEFEAAFKKVSLKK